VTGYEELIKRFVTWAEGRPDIHAAIVLGSRASVVSPADKWSDLDLVLIVSEPDLYLLNTDWLKNIANFSITFVEPTATGGEMERRVLFEGGFDVDFSILPYAKVEKIIKEGVPRYITEIFNRGIRVLFDRKDLAIRLIPLSTIPEPYSPPAQSEFKEMCNDFWLLC
jgi:aminoglycoside 6-adenylyltransferase